MNLLTAFTKNLPQWNSILTQIGLPYTEINWKENLNEEYAVIILNSDIKRVEQRLLFEFVETGGSLIAEASFVNDFVRTKKVSIKYLYSEQKIFNYHLPLIDLYKENRIASNSNLLSNQDGLPVIASFNLGKGNVIIVPDKLVSSISDSEIIRKSFPSSSKKYPSERVSKISKGGIYHLLRASLESLYHKRNLPFVTKWNFPGNNKNIFAFRIDTDFGSQDEVESLYKTLVENDIRGTWFIETKSKENWLSKFALFKDQEIALHCYRHRVFKSYKKNYDNIDSGIKALKKSAISPKGMAGPFGEWNKTFFKAAEYLGFEYSSEFSFSYDNFPQQVFLEKKIHEIIQIPIHPISFGRLFHAGFSDDEMCEYFIDVIKTKLALAEPVIIYTHPKEKRYEILKRIFNFVNEMNLKKYTFNEYSDWWKARTKIEFSASFVNREVKIESNNKDENFWFRIIYPSKENFLIPASGDIFKKIEINIPEFVKKIDAEKLRKYTKRMLKDDILFKVRKRKL